MDATRKRRQGNSPRARWYALHRARRFAKSSFTRSIKLTEWQRMSLIFAKAV